MNDGSMDISTLLQSIIMIFQLDAVASESTFLTVFQFLAVIGTPRVFSTLAANFERPIPSGAYR